MTLRWNLLGLEQFGGSASDIQTAASDPTSRTPLHYFLLAFPVQVVHGIVERTNTKIRAGTGRQTQMTARFF